MGKISFDFKPEDAGIAMPSFWKSRVDLAKKLEKIDFLLYRNNVGCFPRGDIQAITGKKKCGKSTAASIFVQAMLAGEFGGFRTADGKPKKVLVVDTEQNYQNIILWERRILKAIGEPDNENNANLFALALRPCGWRERLKQLAEAVEFLRPDFIFVDGAADLVKSINDEETSAEAIQTLMSITQRYKCACLVVLHYNKQTGKDGTGLMCGYLGTELGNKVSETYEVTRATGAGESDTTTVTQIDCRNGVIPPFAFTMNGEAEKKWLQIVDVLTPAGKG